jgi:hypothetical protein
MLVKTTLHQFYISAIVNMQCGNGTMYYAMVYPTGMKYSSADELNEWSSGAKKESIAIRTLVSWCIFEVDEAQQTKLHDWHLCCIPITRSLSLEERVACFGVRITDAERSMMHGQVKRRKKALKAHLKNVVGNAGAWFTLDRHIAMGVIARLDDGDISFVRCVCRLWRDYCDTVVIPFRVQKRGWHVDHTTIAQDFTKDSALLDHMCTKLWLMRTSRLEPFKAFEVLCFTQGFAGFGERDLPGYFYNNAVKFDQLPKSSVCYGESKVLCNGYVVRKQSIKRTIKLIIAF